MSILSNNIDEMHGLIQPNPVDFAPVTIGWYLLSLIAIIGVCLIVVAMIKRYIKRKYRRQATKILIKQIEPRLHNEKEKQTALFQIAALIKSVAIQSYSREKVAHLYGAEWNAFLTTTCKSVSFKSSIGTNLLGFQYLPTTSLNQIDKSDLHQLIRDTKKWIGGHRV